MSPVAIIDGKTAAALQRLPANLTPTQRRKALLDAGWIEVDRYRDRWRPRDGWRPPR